MQLKQLKNVVEVTQVCLQCTAALKTVFKHVIDINMHLLAL